jgi:hypothetical protein
MNGAEPPSDTDNDGMPDAWEQAKSLDLNNAEDRNGDADGDGYTNLETYLAERAQEVMGKTGSGEFMTEELTNPTAPEGEP